MIDYNATLQEFFKEVVKYLDSRASHALSELEYQQICKAREQVQKIASNPVLYADYNTRVANGVEPDALKKYHITGAKKISVVNDYHLGDAFSKAMNRKGEMNKYRGRYEFPCKPEVHELVKTWWGGIDTSEVTCIEYTQNSKIVKVKGEWYRCKNW